MKMNKNKADIPSLLKSFLIDHLQNELNASPHTVTTYSDTFRLLLEYLQEYHRVRPERITLKDLSVKNIRAFLDYLQRERKNGINTRNSRLAAIRSFANYLLIVNPIWNADLQGILAIPVKKNRKKTLDYLSQEEMECLLEIPDQKTWTGQRDYILLMIMYNTGARVSEIIRLKVSDVKFESTTKISLLGKGRKERALPLWKSAAQQLRKWVEKNGYTQEMPLFPNGRGKFMSRWGVKNRLEAIVNGAKGKNPSLKSKRISPHTIRHTTAMHFLQSGIDIKTIAMWLGHESVETTQIYVTSDMEMKERALKTLQEPKTKVFRYKPTDSLLKFLENM